MAGSSTAFFASDLLRITRFWNLLIIGLTQYFTVGFLLSPDLLFDWRLLLLTTSTVVIAAAGYIINDYYDVKIDLINKPERVVIGRRLTRRYALFLHTLLSLAGTAFGFVLNWKIGVVNFLSAFLLWWYSNNLKRLPLVGNMAVALLTGLSVFIVTLLYPAFGKTYVIIYGVFAFFMTLVREVIKDMEDLKGDNTFGCRTLPIVFGLRKTKTFIYLLTFFFLLIMVAVHVWVEALPIYYFLLFLFLPVAVLMARLHRADTKREFYELSSLCKIIMLLGILSMAFV